MPFDLSRYQVGREPREHIISVEGEPLKLMIRDLPWSLKNQKKSLAARYDSEGKGWYDHDFYNKECLKYIIVEAPWGKTDELFLLSLRSGTPLITELEKLVPPAIEDEMATGVSDTRKKSV